MTREAALLHLHFHLEGGGTDCFGEKLMALVFKADNNNKEKLRLGFPEYVQVWEDYFEGRVNSKGEELCKEH